MMGILGGVLILLALIYVASRYLVTPFWLNYIDPDPGIPDWERSGLNIVLSGVTFLVVNWLMAISYWFASDHYSFWHGLKELIWALIPILNIFYVWEWWAMAGYLVYFKLLGL